MDREGGTANHHRPSRNQRGLQFAAVNNLLSMFKRGQDKLAEQVANAKRAPRDQTVRAHVRPNTQVRKQIARLEKVAGALPLSLRIFYEVVGSVDWIGSHPTLAPADSDI